MTKQSERHQQLLWTYADTPQGIRRARRLLTRLSRIMYTFELRYRNTPTRFRTQQDRNTYNLLQYVEESLCGVQYAERDLMMATSDGRFTLEATPVLKVYHHLAHDLRL